MPAIRRLESDRSHRLDVPAAWLTIAILVAATIFAVLGLLAKIGT